MDLGHAPAFAGMTLLAIRRIESHRVQIFIVIVIFACSVAAEFLQSFVGRLSSWHDVWGNLCGVVAGWSLIEVLERSRSRLWLFLPACCLLVGAWSPLYDSSDMILQAWQRPLLGSFEFAIEMQRWTVQEGRLKRASEPVSHGSSSLCVELQAARYPGVTLRWPFRDWDRYQRLEMDVHLDSGEPVGLVVKVHDATHNQDPDDRFDRLETLNSGWNRISVHLDDVRNSPKTRKMDMRAITILQLFTPDLRSPRTLHVDHVRLVGG